MRKKYVAANWKLNKNPIQTTEYFEEFLNLANEDEESNFLFFLPAINLTTAQSQIEQTQIGWGAQNVYFEANGAFTGENSVDVTKQIGCSHVLVGHSERRSLFSETNNWVSKKVQISHEFGLTPVLCVGESLQERESGSTNSVLKAQLVEGLADVDLSKPLILAYEPVWAIGTGKVATPDMANEAHVFIRETLNSLDKDLGNSISILYGGSVKPENSSELIKQKDIDGFLVGGASLKPDSFYQIYKATV